MTPPALELASASDRFYDYCLWEYQPTGSAVGKLRLVNLLHQSFVAAGAPERAHELVPVLRAGIGADRTVWGLKLKGATIGWELYFYDYRRRERQTSITRTLKALQPLARSPLTANENLHYFMFSLDFDAPLFLGQRDLAEVHVYVGNPGSAVSSGIGYSMTAHGMRLENFYFFFDAHRHQDDILAKVVCSAHLDTTRIPVEEVLWPELVDCRIIVVANKQTHDGVYFSGLTVHQLILFMTRMHYPAALLDFIVENRDRLDHMQYDVGFDYRQEGDRLVILKSGYYGFF